jgi:hypothetical protein
MYEAYQGLLDSLASRMGWSPHALVLGEDLSYGNMVACPSAKWLTAEDPQNPDMPVMPEPTVEGIVNECFHKRRYFLRQLFQSLPAVLLVFSQTTTDAFIAAMRGHIIAGSPRPGDSIPALLDQKIVMRYGRVGDTDLTVRVIFTPHASADPQAFAAQRGKIVNALVDEAQAGRLVFNRSTGHLGRPAGSCVFCTNALYRIGPCDYEQELRPLAGDAPSPTLGVRMASPDSVRAEKALQQRLLDEFIGKGTANDSAHAGAKERAPAGDVPQTALSPTQKAFRMRL